jgi:hypothetical protein
MGGTPPGGRNGRVRSWFADLGFRQMRQAVVVVILAATALFGGLDNVETKVTHFKLGEEFSDGEFTLTVDRASLVRELRAGETQLPPKPGRRYLGVVADVRNAGTVPGKLEGELDLRGEANTRFIGASRMKDGTPVGLLGPGLSDQLAFFWEVPDDAVKAGESVTFRVWQKQFQELRVTYGKTWLDSLTEYGQIEIPVKVNP